MLFSQHFSAARTGNLHANPYEISVNKAGELKDIAKEKGEQKNKKMSTKVCINLAEKSVPSTGKAHGWAFLAVIESIPEVP
jgi:hypothetical protein